MKGKNTFAIIGIIFVILLANSLLYTILGDIWVDLVAFVMIGIPILLLIAIIKNYIHKE